MNMQRIISIAVLGIALVAPARAQDAYDGEWHYSLAPYLWLPSIHGSLRFDLPEVQSSADATVKPRNYLSALKFAMMLSGEARKANFAVVTDLMYLDMGSSGSTLNTVRGPLGRVEVPVDVGTKTKLRGGIWMLGGSYTVARSPAATLDVLGGFRYVGLRTSLDWNVAIGSSGLLPTASGSVSKNVDLWDGIVGARGRIALGEGNWFVPYYADVGTGDTKLSWQAMTGVGHRYRWGEVLLAWRHLSIDQGDNKLIQNMRLSGPAFAAVFHW